jgi:hypothetical protein
VENGEVSGKLTDYGAPIGFLDRYGDGEVPDEYTGFMVYLLNA